MSKVIMIGCDLHDASMLLKIAEGRGEPETRSFRNSEQGRQGMIADLGRRSTDASGVRVVFAYEASSLGFGLYDQLTDAGVECHVLAPTRIERSSKHQRTKTDERDAQRLLEIVRGHVLAGNPLPAVWVPDPQTRDDREVVRARLDVREKVTRVKAQIQTLFKRHQIAKPEGIGTAWSCRHRAWVQGLALGQGALTPGVEVALGTLWRQLIFLEEEIGLLDAKVAQLAQGPRYAGPVRALCRFKGVAILTAMVFLTEMGDLSRFSNRRQVGAYLGLAPSSAESGETTDRKGHITHQGPSRVRKVLCQAVWSALRVDAGLKGTHARLTRGQRKRRKTATVALMRQLGVRMWHVGLKAQRQGGSFGPAPVQEEPSMGERDGGVYRVEDHRRGTEQGPADARPSPPSGHRPRRSGRTPVEPYPPRRQTGV